MQVCSCPHCGTPRIITSKVPRDVVVVMSCPHCRELVVLFRNKAVALSRRILETGSFEERKDHFATVITEFFEPGMLGLPPMGEAVGEVAEELSSDDELFTKEESESSDVSGPISEKEFDEFVRVGLTRIDEASYFKRHFG